MSKINPNRTPKAQNRAVTEKVQTKNAQEVPKEVVKSDLGVSVEIPDGVELRQDPDGGMSSSHTVAFVPDDPSVKAKLSKEGVIFPEIKAAVTNSGNPDAEVAVLVNNQPEDPSQQNILASITVPKSYLEADPNTGQAPISEMSPEMVPSSPHYVVTTDEAAQLSQVPVGYELKLQQRAKGEAVAEKLLNVGGNLGQSLASSSMTGLFSLPGAPIVGLAASPLTLMGNLQELKELSNQQAYIEAMAGSGREKVPMYTPGGMRSYASADEAMKVIRHAKQEKYGRVAGSVLTATAGVLSLTGVGTAAVPFVAGAAMLTGHAPTFITSGRELKSLNAEKKELLALQEQGQETVTKTMTTSRVISPETRLAELNKLIDEHYLAANDQSNKGKAQDIREVKHLVEEKQVVEQFAKEGHAMIQVPKIDEVKMPISMRLEQIDAQIGQQSVKAVSGIGAVGGMGAMIAGLGMTASLAASLGPVGVALGAKTAIDMKKIAGERKDLKAKQALGETHFTRQVLHEGKVQEVEIPIADRLKDISKEMKKKSVLLTGIASAGTALGVSVATGMSLAVTAPVMLVPIALGAALLPEESKALMQGLGDKLKMIGGKLAKIPKAVWRKIKSLFTKDKGDKGVVQGAQPAPLGKAEEKMVAAFDKLRGIDAKAAEKFATSFAIMNGAWEESGLKESEIPKTPEEQQKLLQKAAMDFVEARATLESKDASAVSGWVQARDEVLEEQIAGRVEGDWGRSILENPQVQLVAGEEGQELAKQTLTEYMTASYKGERGLEWFSQLEQGVQAQDETAIKKYQLVQTFAPILNPPSQQETGAPQAPVAEVPAPQAPAPQEEQPVAKAQEKAVIQESTPVKSQAPAKEVQANTEEQIAVEASISQKLFGEVLSSLAPEQGQQMVAEMQGFWNNEQVQRAISSPEMQSWCESRGVTLEQAVPMIEASLLSQLAPAQTQAFAQKAQASGDQASLMQLMAGQEAHQLVGRYIQSIPLRDMEPTQQAIELDRVTSVLTEQGQIGHAILHSTPVLEVAEKIGFSAKDTKALYKDMAKSELMVDMSWEKGLLQTAQLKDESGASTADAEKAQQKLAMIQTMRQVGVQIQQAQVQGSAA